MKIALLQNDKSFLSFDLKDLLWLILVVGVWATQDYRITYTNNVLRWNDELQDKTKYLTTELRQQLVEMKSLLSNLDFQLASRVDAKDEAAFLSGALENAQHDVSVQVKQLEKVLSE